MSKKDTLSLAELAEKHWRFHAISALTGGFMFTVLTAEHFLPIGDMVVVPLVLTSALFMIGLKFYMLGGSSKAGNARLDIWNMEGFVSKEAGKAYKLAWNVTVVVLAMVSVIDSVAAIVPVEPLMKGVVAANMWIVGIYIFSLTVDREDEGDE